MADASESPSVGDRYRKRVADLTKRLKRKSMNAAARAQLEKKRKALSDMADNEDWLEGKVKAKD
jgi:hypothetical protein